MRPKRRCATAHINRKLTSFFFREQGAGGEGVKVAGGGGGGGGEKGAGEGGGEKEKTEKRNKTLPAVLHSIYTNPKFEDFQAEV